MIASPCRNCSRADLPKTICAEDCGLLHAVQELQSAIEGRDVSSRKDYCEEMGYAIPLSIETTSATLWSAFCETEM